MNEHTGNNFCAYQIGVFAVFTYLRLSKYENALFKGEQEMGEWDRIICPSGILEVYLKIKSQW